MIYNKTFELSHDSLLEELPLDFDPETKEILVEVNIISWSNTFFKIQLKMVISALVYLLGLTDLGRGFES